MEKTIRVTTNDDVEIVLEKRVYGESGMICDLLEMDDFDLLPLPGVNAAELRYFVAWYSSDLPQQHAWGVRDISLFEAHFGSVDDAKVAAALRAAEYLIMPRISSRLVNYFYQRLRRWPLEVLRESSERTEKKLQLAGCSGVRVEEIIE